MAWNKQQQQQQQQEEEEEDTRVPHACASILCIKIDITTNSFQNVFILIKLKLIQVKYEQQAPISHQNDNNPLAGVLNY
jgi:hypothetical protein